MRRDRLGLQSHSFSTILIADATNALALITASLGDLPLAKYAVVAAAECTTGTVVVALLEHICC